MSCRHCGSPLELCVIDLGFAPPSNAYRRVEDLHRPETTFPLRVFACESCWLVQTEDYAAADALFTPDYAYFSSASRGWMAHAERYAEMVTGRLGLGADSMVIEVASNDGYLLRNFVAKGVPCLGIEPTDSTADAAEAAGVPTRRAFFGQALAEALVAEGKAADLVAGNNVLAHVPDINDFVRGLATVLKPGGTVTLEFPHLLRLIEEVQFDTIYHEHYSYLSLSAVARVLASAGLKAIDVEHLSTHGGSLRLWAARQDDARAPGRAVAEALAAEERAGLERAETYAAFQTRANTVKDRFLEFLIAEKRAGRRVAAYGAAAKGNTLMNYAGLKTDLIAFVCDIAPSKQGMLMPGSHIPILPPEALAVHRPDTVVILPWNIADEVRSSQAHIREWGGRFAIALPEMRVFD
ncbi:MAG: class I SAM-dependent methyltransferase [Pseudomonadota bacterium]